jgi:hypothetical protein
MPLTRKQNTKTETAKTFANHEVVVLAAYLAGAQSTAADTEDIAIKADELAPGRFAWRKYKKQINIEAVRKRLWDAVKPDKGAYLIGSEKTGWRLTKAGFDFAVKNLKEISPDHLRGQRSSQAEQTTKTREIRRMSQEDAFIKFQKGMIPQITKAEAERFFRIDDYVVGAMRRAKIERFKIMSAGNKELISAIAFLSTLVREE